ncbi:protein UPSTREAM OF FLC [Solanum pennellii]|uniref:Protein UPSTREAM OF FLC n=1 Tax=Solanum pennellii TaxID=28526 RepID=A0ABM1VI01_SOLPN|nr:protein UPSTREAM OF FLC [Solanum pennellii]XP_027775369.1 protein UPSTREAM OF FLC [Solanum pennellii]
MEGQNHGGGEVRRLHIIYFLSRKGRIEHPHLIRVHHFSRNGIRLKDIKRWLGELRGKDMPESFAWSYKRKYKTGYVWQDLLDEDLITPISDNEYVLKGSEIPSITIIKDVSSGEKEVTKEQTKQEDQDQVFLMDSSKKISSEIEEDSQNISSETSTLTTNSPKFEEEEEKKIGNNSSFSSNSSSSISSFGSMKTKKKTEDSEEKTETSQNDEKTSKNPKLNKSRSYSNGASSIFRNLITCGAVDTNDSGIIPLKKNKTSSAAAGEKTVSFSSEICKADKIGGSQRIFGTAWNQQQTNARKSCDGAFSMSKNRSEFGSRRSVSANYKPINGPNCSQCGKPFKPEKLHAHMKSCKGMKALSKAATHKTYKDSPKIDSL